MNQVILLGRLTKDPESRYTTEGKCLTKFTIAVQGDYGSEVDYIPITTWEKTAEACGNNLKKGRQILVRGRLKIRSYDAEDGSKRYMTNVVAQHVRFLAKPVIGAEAAKLDGESFGTEVVPDEEIPF